MEKQKSIGKDILSLAAGFGLLTGLVEGIELLSLHQMQRLTWRLYNRAMWYETLWIAPLVDLVLFSLLGVFLMLAGKVLPKVSLKKPAWFLFIFLCVFDWVFIVLYGKISLLALLVLVAGLSVQLTSYATKFESSLISLTRRMLPWLAGTVAAILLVIQGGGWVNEKVKTANLPKAQPNTPNVIVIVVDALRADHLSGYGYDRNTSPFVDTLIDQGVLFKDAISASSWTQPSHAAMLTGRYTYETQAELKPLDGRYPTIGEVLQSHGYRTGAFSANTEFFSRRQGFGRGFLHFEDNYQSIQDDFINSSLYGFIFDFYGLRKALKYEGTPGRKLAESIDQSILNWVDKDKQKPFFVFVNYYDVHDPYLPPEPYRSRYSTVSNPGGLINGYVERFSPDLTPDQIQSEMDAYDGSINYVDDQIKSLFNELQERGLLENTLVIITSDHGESFGEHNLLQHSGSLYIEQIHVPLVFWWPGHIPAKKSVDVPVTNSGIPATVLSLIQAKDDLFPGPSLTSLIFDQNSPKDWPYPISEIAQFPGASQKNPSTHGAMSSVVGPELQYIVHEKFGEELYSWKTDPKETENLIGDPSRQSAVDQFKKYLEGLIGKLILTNP